MRQTDKIPFMLAGPLMSFEAPDGFPTRPTQMSSPINITGPCNGRECIWSSPAMSAACADEDLFPAESYNLRAELAAVGGQRIEVYEHVGGDIVQWYLHWVVDAGHLVMHLREEDGFEASEIVAANLDVIENAESGVVSLLPSGPLERGVSAQPGFAETALFAQHDAEGRELASVVLSRPGLTRVGEVQLKEQVNDDGSVGRTHRVGLDGDVTAMVSGRGESAIDTELVDSLLSSFTLG